MKEETAFLPYMSRHESTKVVDLAVNLGILLKGNNSMLLISLMRALCLSSRPGTFCLAVQSVVDTPKIQNLIMLIFQNISPIHEHAIYSDLMS